MSNFGEITNPPNLGSGTGGTQDPNKCKPKYCCLVEDFEATIFGTFHLDANGNSQPDYLSGSFKYAAYIKCMIETSGTPVGLPDLGDIQKGCRETLGIYDCVGNIRGGPQSKDGFNFVDIKNSEILLGPGETPQAPYPITTPKKPGVLWQASSRMSKVSECAKNTGWGFEDAPPCPSCIDPGVYPVVGIGPSYYETSPAGHGMYPGELPSPDFMWSDGICQKYFTLTSEDLGPGFAKDKSEENLFKRLGKKLFQITKFAQPWTECGSIWIGRRAWDIKDPGYGRTATISPPSVGKSGSLASWYVVEPGQLGRLMKNFASTFCGKVFGDNAGLQNCKKPKTTESWIKCITDDNPDNGDDPGGTTVGPGGGKSLCWRCVRVPNPDAPPGHSKTKVECKKIAARLKQDDIKNGLKKGDCPNKTYEKSIDCEANKLRDCPPPTPPPPS